jgi:GntR family transcriptional regulator, rspAB operon transcriptional repressor
MNTNSEWRLNGAVDPAKSIADQIYETLKNAIIRGKIEPNQRLFEVEVSKIFNASRTPVREAFRRLEQDGIAERLAQGGIRLARFDEETIRDLFNLRLILEVHAFELAVARITAEEIASLKQIRAQANELLKSDDISQDFTLNRFFELSSMFHDTIYNATHSKFLIKVLSNIHAMVLSLRSMSIRLDSIREVWDEHSRLIDHLERKEKAAAVRLIKQHLSGTASQVLSFVRSEQTDASDPSRPDPSQHDMRGRKKAVKTRRRTG